MERERVSSGTRVLGIDVPGKHDGGWAVYDPINRCMEECGTLSFDPSRSERDDLRYLAETIYRISRKWGIRSVAIEHPFLYLIAQHIGAIKMALALHRKPELRWIMLTVSQAEKLVFGHAFHGTKDRKSRKDRKAHIRSLLEQRWEDGPLSLHQADALLYAIAGSCLDRGDAGPVYTRR